jgi:hypothetical protein
MGSSELPVSPETIRWFLGLVLTGMAVGLVLLFRMAMQIGEMRLKVNTLWKWWIYHKPKLGDGPEEDVPGKRIR